MRDSSILPGMGRREMGLSSSGELGLETLGMGITLAIFQAEGKIPDVIEVLNRWVVSLCRKHSASLRILELSWSRPEDLVIGMERREERTWFSVTGESDRGWSLCVL